MYQKFIITDDGELRFGNVYHHRNLLRWDESCHYGGGLWRIDKDPRGMQHPDILPAEKLQKLTVKKY